MASCSPHIHVCEYEQDRPTSHIRQEEYEEIIRGVGNAVRGPGRRDPRAVAESDEPGRSLRLLLRRGPRPAAAEDFAAPRLPPQGRPGHGTSGREVDALLHRGAEAPDCPESLHTNARRTREGSGDAARFRSPDAGLLLDPKLGAAETRAEA